MSHYVVDSSGEPQERNAVPEVSVTLQEVAWKRGVQTFMVGLIVDLLVALALLWATVANSIGTWEALLGMGFAVTKTVITTTLQYVFRRFVDISGFNRDGTPKFPLPNQSAPDEEAP